MLASSGFYLKDTIEIVLTKLNGKDFSESCILDTTDIQVESFDEFTADTFSYQWENYISDFDTFDLFIADIDFESEDLCPPPLFPDAIIANIREMESCPSGTKVIVDICNVGQEVLEQGLSIATYDENPTIQNSKLLSTTVLPRDLSVGDCQQMILNLPFGSSRIFTVLNDTGSVVLPYHLGWSFPQNERRECTYLNNMDSLSLSSYIPQPINLGADKKICEGEGVRYELLGNYTSIEWHDGSTNNIYDANSSEEVSVTAIDSCGTVFRDTAVVSVNPNYLLEIDTIIPQGGTYWGVQYFMDTTFTQDLISIDGCDSIVQVNLMVEVSNVNLIVKNLEYKVYPNPTNDYIFIETSEVLKGKNRLICYNSLGQEVSVFSLFTNLHRQKINLKLTSGIYFLVLKGDSGTFGIERLVVR